MSEGLGRAHFWISLVAMNGIFLPMFIQGLAGVNRRLYDAGRSYSYFAGLEGTFAFQAWAAGLLAVGQLLFIANLVHSLVRGARTSPNPWSATTLEWATASPPPHENFPVTPTVHRGPYDYSLPGAKADFAPQTQP